ncbi:ribosomal L7Ae/L30e/S12e/Gadd45 family protein [Butyricicoccus sp. OF10-2]|uniref:ribosomal L7Ae/L30e/S12e/Gadd45 family protein n=1 Tax=Butyricicoccus sp. OF10-2 TaxID=2292298 RepID=UPI001314F5E9|nr:ribosomal L7Ae/L30e/S12e/Gadd45 family protein [Butyricicoccus sp. OF10-2]
MATDPVLRMLGLARRAGKLAYGDELVREACFDHKTRCVFIAGDAGANAAKKAAFYADKANVPCVTLPHGKLELGSAIGKAGCAMCAVADIGMAAAAVNKLAEQDPAYAEVAQQLSEKNAKIQSRRGVKKHKDKAEKTEEAPVKTEKSAEEKPKRTYRKPSGDRPFRKEGDRPYRKNDGEKRPFRKDGEYRPYRKNDGEKRPFRKDGEYRPYRKNDGEKRPFRKDGERRPYRKSGAGKPSFNSGKRSSAIKRNFPRRSAHSNSKA